MAWSGLPGVGGLVATASLALGLAPVTGGRAVADAAGEERNVPQATEQVVELRAGDFRYGTYIIDRPGTYRLMEDIEFDPNSPAALSAAVEDALLSPAQVQQFGLHRPIRASESGRPLPSQFRSVPGEASFEPGGPTDARYDRRAYGVGFFAAIAVQADDVVIDLNGFELRQSEQHALLQRFFAVIELADQPFKPRQGPASFGTSLRPARHVIIRNGTIGRSAHHGIHGNDAVDVWIHDVEFRDFEVAAIALNGVHGLRVERVSARNTIEIPVLGTYSAAVFIKPYLDDLLRRGVDVDLRVSGALRTLPQIRERLVRAINAVHADLIESGSVDAEIDAHRHPVERALFHNPTGLLDGNSYSFLVHSSGVAINGFPERRSAPPDQRARDVAFDEVRIERQIASIDEVLAVDSNGSEPGGTAVIDPVGSVFQLFNVDEFGHPITISSSDLEVAEYVGNPVADAQALVAKAASLGYFDGSPLDVSRLNFPAPLLDWIEARPGAETLASIDVRVICNGDSMFHVNKGVIGLRIDGVDGATVRNVSVDLIENRGESGEEACFDESFGQMHPLGNVAGHDGATTRGMTIAGSTDVLVENLTLEQLLSDHGHVIGVDVINDSSNVTVRGFSMTTRAGGSAAALLAEVSGPISQPVHTMAQVSPSAELVHLEPECERGTALAIGNGAVVGSCR